MKKEDLIFLKANELDYYFVPSDDTSKELWDMYDCGSGCYVEYVVYSAREDCGYILMKSLDRSDIIGQELYSVEGGELLDIIRGAFNDVENGDT